MTEPRDNALIRAFELPLHRAPADVWPLIREGWRKSVELANWCVTTMLSLDDPAAARPPEFDLYARAFGRAAEKRGRKDAAKVLPARKAAFPGGEFFGGAMLSAASIIEDVQREYRADRFEVFFRRSRSPRIYRSFPFPVHGQMVKDAWLDGDGRPWVRLTLPGGRVELQLKNGREFAPQMAKFHDLVRRKEQGLPFREVVLREKRCRGGDCMVKFVYATGPRERPGDRPLVLTLGPQNFWRADFIREGVGGRCFVRAWVLNNDHWRGVAARHAKHLGWLERTGQDAKAERRLGSNRAREQARRLEIACEKDKNRLASFAHEAAAQLAGFCERNGVGEVYYLDRDRGFMTWRESGEPLPFPWRQLHDKLAQKLEERGIALHLETAPGVTPSAGPEENPDGEIVIEPEDERWLRLDRLRERAGLRVLEARRRSSSPRAATAR